VKSKKQTIGTILNKGFLSYPIKVSAYKPRKHQQRAIRNANIHYVKENNTRGKLIMPCGSGKSLASYWIEAQSKAFK